MCPLRAHKFVDQTPDDKLAGALRAHYRMHRDTLSWGAFEAPRLAGDPVGLPGGLPRSPIAFLPSLEYVGYMAGCLCLGSRVARDGTCTCIPGSAGTCVARGWTCCGSRDGFKLSGRHQSFYLMLFVYECLLVCTMISGVLHGPYSWKRLASQVFLFGKERRNTK